MIDKVVPSFDEAVADIPSGATIHVGGLTHWPSALIAAIARVEIRDLTVICCHMALAGPTAGERSPTTLGLPGLPLDPPDLITVGLLIELGRIRKGVTSFASVTRGDRRSPLEELVEAGLAEVELSSQGALAERIRAARSGIAAFFTTTGVGTPLAEGKEVREFNGVPHVMETALPADFALIRAHAADRWGNLAYNQPPSFNHTMAGAARVTIAEVDRIVPLGKLAPSDIRTPGVFVDRVVERPATPAGSWRDRG